ncbi:MAG: AAA family ATPase [Deltaproteobacteria bacterium]|nr:AAA family ATPase [Deltaproteobacteria bacterium]
MNEPEVIVCAGGGGVGKTTASAALALALARRGRRALIVSIDPARRLADAMGVALDGQARLVSLEAPERQLYGLMPDPRRAMRTFIQILFEDHPEALARMLDNRLYQVLEDAVPGIHELVAMTLTARAVTDHDIEVVIIDTAPSRYALDFVRYPGRLAKLLGGRAVGWLARLAQRGQETDASDGQASPSRIERLLAWVLGPVVIDVAGLFAEMALVREPFVALNEQTSRLLLGPATKYVVVAAPTEAAKADAQFLIAELAKLEIRTTALVLNSALSPGHDFRDILGDAPDTTAAMHEVLQSLDHEWEGRARSVQAISDALAQSHPALPQLRLPHVERADPRGIVEALALAFDVELERFGLV